MTNETIRRIIDSVRQNKYMECSKCNQPTGASWKTLCPVCWKNQTPEEIRAYRQAKIDRKVNRLLKAADNRDKQATVKMAGWEEARQDWAYVTQPNINTSKGRAFTRSRERVINRFDAGVRLSIEADELRSKAEWLQKTGARVKGDAERERQEERDKADSMFSLGSRINCAMYGDGEIIKVNKKTYSVKFDRGFSINIDKSWVF